MSPLLPLPLLDLHLSHHIEIIIMGAYHKDVRAFTSSSHCKVTSCSCLVSQIGYLLYRIVCPSCVSSADTTPGTNSPTTISAAEESAPSTPKRRPTNKEDSGVGDASDKDNSELQVEGNAPILGGEEANRWAPGTTTATGALRVSLLKARGAATRYCSFRGSDLGLVVGWRGGRVSCSIWDCQLSSSLMR